MHRRTATPRVNRPDAWIARRGVDLTPQVWASPCYPATLLPCYPATLLQVRLPPDTEVWAAGEPEDGWAEGDDDNEEECEPSYAREALDRLCEALDGDAIGASLLASLPTLAAEAGAGWRGAHAALVAVAVVSEHCASLLATHVAALAANIAAHAASTEPRVRWASPCYHATLPSPAALLPCY